MKHKTFTLFLLLITAAFAAEANPVDLRTAREVAMKFVNANAKTPLRGENDLQLAKTYNINRGDAAFYVFNAPNGFVIVSADDCAYPILGYSDEGRRFDVNNVPIQLQDILREYLEQIQYAVENNLQPDEATSQQWRLVKTTGMLSENRDRTQVGPLLTTTWDQGQYYNAMCPEDANGPDGHCVTGCVATAMAQIIKYHGYPASGRGTHSYNSDYGTLTVNYAESVYDYTNMPDALTNESSVTEVNAVAKLMYDCGVSVSMLYTANESAAYTSDARSAFINYFKYSPDLSYAQKLYYSDTEWDSLFRINLEATTPIYMNNSGHAFVCDGYDTEDFYHFNFGWSGNSDGWYVMSAVNDDGGLVYMSAFGAILGITPDPMGNIIIGQTLGNSYFTLNEPMEFYSSMGHNQYMSTYYTNNCHNSISFSSADTTKRLVIDVINYESQSLWFYDVMEGNQLINPTTTDIGSIYMTGNTAAFYYDGYMNYKGFALYIRHEDDCQIPTIVIERDTTSISVENLNYETMASWQIEYGLKGFTQGEGTTINAETPFVTIDNLIRYETYDVYARTVCSESQTSPWVKQTVLLDPYWTDVVTTQPPGFIEDNQGNIEISSAEGLAWLSILVNGFHGHQPNSFEGKTVVLTADIDLDGYRWYPMGRYLDWGWTQFSGTFNGQNHSIANIYVRDASSNLGLFGRVYKGRIKNVNMVGGSVCCTLEKIGDDPQYWLPSSTIGGLAGETRDCLEISNCHSSVDVSGNGGAGSLCGYIWAYEDNVTTKIYNCSASGNVYGRDVCGGLLGGVFGDVEIRNCYSTSDVFITTCDFDAWEQGRGGLIGSFRQRPSVYNCFSTGIVYYDSSYTRPKGKLIGYDHQNAHIQFLYGRDDINLGLSLFGYDEDVYISDTAQFHHNGITNVLLTPVSVEGVEKYDLLEALNAWVIAQNDYHLKTWILDDNTGYPVFGDYYEPSCYNPEDLVISNATIVGDTIIRTELSWTQIGEPDYWEILYVASEHSIDEGTIVTVNSNPCILTGIPVGHPLDFYVRSICGDEDVSGWSTMVTYIPDKLRWTEVVTSQPEGYIEDEDGNVYISSAEGLAWLSSVVNGLNGVEYNGDRFRQKRIELLSDINISDYRWTAIGKNWEYSFNDAVFNGNYHSIIGLYCNELEDQQGLFGYFYIGSVSNVLLNDCNVLGENMSGSMVGYALGVDLVNCAAVGNVCGIEEVGGLVGRHESSDIPNIINCYFRGNIVARQDITKSNTNIGHIGGICGNPYNDSIVNCYVVSEITDTVVYPGIITGTGGGPFLVSNCYYKDYETTLSVTNENCVTTNNSSFSGSGTTWTLNNPPYIHGEFRTDLLDALNAWVDANNTNGEYLHWVADTAMVNGGFPILEQLPATTMQTAELSSGWNWWSTYVQLGTDGLSNLETGLGNNADQIKSWQDGYVNRMEYQGYVFWSGSLNAVHNDQMYMIHTNEACPLQMTGIPVSLVNTPITLNPGWNWIGFPSSLDLPVSDALSLFDPQPSDVIKGRNGYASFVIYGSYSFWSGSLSSLVPGQGYKYYSNSGTPKTVAYSSARGDAPVVPVSSEPSACSLTPVVDRFASNMTVTAVVDVEGVELRSGDYELAAFVGDECRGCVKLVYVEPLDRFLAFLLVFGEENENLRFALTDGRGLNWSVDRMVYSVDGMAGSPTEPVVLHFGPLGVNESVRNAVVVYPNPSKDVFNIEGKGIRRIEVVNAFGLVIYSKETKDDLLQIDLNGHASGVYLLRMVTDDGIMLRQVVKE